MREHRPRRRFSQNFLVDRNYIERIVDAIAPEPDDRVLEIGPGRGALTGLLAARTNNLVVVEIDRDLARDIELQWPEVTVVAGDVMKLDLEKLLDASHLCRVVGNLPYHIATPLLFVLLRFSERIEDMYFTLQEELVERICASPGTKAWGRLSVMMQYHAEVTPLFRVPSSAFRPRPRVESRMLKVKPRAPAQRAKSLEVLEDAVRRAFSQRRKTLQNALKSHPRFRSDAAAEELEQLGIDLTSRPETFGVDDFVAISNVLAADD